MRIHGAWTVTGAVAACLIAVTGLNQPQAEPIGMMAAVHGTVTIIHADRSRTTPVAARHSILVNDAIETDVGSKAKALFEDDSLLSLGAMTAIQIAEYHYDRQTNRRRLVIMLERGALRALVGRPLAGEDSLFEVHSGKAVVAVHETYFVVWSDSQGTGVANIGKAGSVDLTASGRTVTVKPGQYSIAPAGKPPILPGTFHGVATASAAEHAIGETEIKDIGASAVLESVDQVIEEELPSCPPGSPPGGICPRQPAKPGLPPQTPPAVTSGAARR